MIVLQIDKNFMSEIFLSCQTVLSIIRMLFSNLSLREPARVSLLFRVPSLICGVFKRLNCLRFLLFTILRIDDQLIRVFSAIFLGAKCVWGRSSCEQTNSSIKSMFSSVETVLGRPDPCLLIHETSFSEFSQQAINRGLIPFFGWMVLPNFVSRPAFFFVIILNDYFIFI